MKLFIYFDTSEAFQEFASLATERLSQKLEKIYDNIEKIFGCNVFHLHIHDEQYYFKKDNGKKIGNEYSMNLSLLFDDNISLEIVSKAIMAGFEKLAPKKDTEALLNSLKEALMK